MFRDYMFCQKLLGWSFEGMLDWLSIFVKVKVKNCFVSYQNAYIKSGMCQTLFKGYKMLYIFDNLTPCL